MYTDNDPTLSRRTVLALVAAGGLAGCSGSLAQSSGATPTPTPTEPGRGGGLEPDDGGDRSGTSLSGSCEAAFGDTGRRYDPGERELLIAYEVPMGGELVAEDTGEDGRATTWHYTDADGTPLQQLVVTERGPLAEPADVGATYVARTAEWEDAGTIAFEGSERTVARRTGDSSVSYVWGFEGPDGTYAVGIQCGVVDGERCPAAYESVCRRVTDSVRRR